MKSVGGRVVCLLTLVLSVAVAGAQQSGAPAASTDPRVGLKPGLKDAGVAASNLELVATLPKPPGFFDPKLPAGEPTGPEPKEGEDDTPKPGAKTKPEPAILSFANSDLGFSGHHLFVGNFNGFNIYDISNPKKPNLVASIVCPGGQGDVSIHGNLLVMSVEQTRGRIDCGVQGVKEAVSTERFRGIRVFDISNIRKPRQVAIVQTCRGSHTHTLVSNPKDSANLYVYGSGTSSVRSAEELAGCSGLDPKEDPNTALFSIDVIKIPIANPEKAKIVSRPRIFADPTSGAISGLWPGGTHGQGTQKTSVTNQCHDITVYPAIGLAAGACSGNGILLDISDPEKPVRLDQVVDQNFAYWHSATFNNDGSKIVFTDEWGGGTRPRCRATDQPTWGADAIFDIVDRKLRFAGYYKLPVPQTETENCVAHNGSLIPVPGRDIMAQAWYQGGISVFDFTDSAKPMEIAYFDRGPVDAKQLVTAGFWSSYWYNGYLYGTEIARGVDIFQLKPSPQLTQNEIDAALLVHATHFNAQEQPKVSWPANPVVAKAYVDQLERAQTIPAERATALRRALDRSDKAQLTALAGELDGAVARASGRDAARLRALATTIKDLTAHSR